MANKMEHFSVEVRLILSQAQAIAEELHHSSIEPEHILLAMAKNEVSIVHEILADEDIIAEKLQPYIKTRIELSKDDTELDLGESTKQLLRLTVEITRKRRDLYFQSFHLLLALMYLNHQGITNILSHFRVESKHIIKACNSYLVEFPEVAKRKLSYRQNFVDFVQQSFQTIFRKKKNDE